MVLTFPLYLNHSHHEADRVAPVKVASELTPAELAARYAADNAVTFDAVKETSAVQVHVTHMGLRIDLNMFTLEVPLHWAEVAGCVRLDGQQSLIVVVLQQPPIGRIAWIVDVNGGPCVMNQVLAAMGAAGAVRHDFHEVYGDSGKPIRKGTFAAVYTYEARGARNDQVAAKIFPATIQDTDEFEMLRNEVRCLAKVPPHVNIISFYGMFFLPSLDQETGFWALVMEYCGRGDLFDLVISGGRCLEADSLFIMQGVFAAVNHLHSNGVIHRDIKPENVLLRDSGQVALCDFGIAASLDDVAELSQFRGTPGYVAPEAIMRSGTTPRLDIFSAGVLMFFTLAGYNLFKGKDVRDTLEKTVRCKVNLEEHPAFAQISSPTKQLVQSIVRKAVDKRPSAEQAMVEVQEIIMTGLMPSSRLRSRACVKAEKEEEETSLSLCTTAVTAGTMAYTEKSPQTMVSEKGMRSVDKGVQTSDAEPESGEVQEETFVDQQTDKDDKDTRLQQRLTQEKHARFCLPPSPPCKATFRKRGVRPRLKLDPRKFVTDGHEQDKGESTNESATDDKTNKSLDISVNDGNKDIDLVIDDKLAKPAKPKADLGSRRCKRNVRLQKLDARKFVTDSVWELAGQDVVSS